MTRSVAPPARLSGAIAFTNTNTNINTNANTNTHTNTNTRLRIRSCVILLLCSALLSVLSSCSGDLVGVGVGVGGLPPDGGGSSQSSAQSDSDLLGETQYDENTRVVVSSAADVYEEPDVTSRRLAQALFNQPVELLETQGKWTRVRFYDELGGSGWVRTDNLDDDWSCADDRLYDAMIVVTDREKAVMSSPKNGVVIRDVGMGVRLFVIDKQDSLYEVAIPGDMSGWTLENGAFWLDVGKDVRKTSGSTFATTAEKFRGAGYLVGGASFQGIDSAGLLYVAASVNGVDLPRDLAGQAGAGESPAAAYGAVGGAADIAADIAVGGAADIAASDPASDPASAAASVDPSGSPLAPGDVLFFYASPADPTLADAGVYVGEDRFVHASQHSGKVQYDLTTDPFFAQRFAYTRRYFPLSDI